MPKVAVPGRTHRPGPGGQAASARTWARLAVARRTPSATARSAARLPLNPLAGCGRPKQIAARRHLGTVARVAAVSGSTGKRVFLESYGCQMNIADSELIGGVLRRAGWTTTTDPACADVLLLNTCAIRENAEERVLGRLGQLLQFKHSRPEVRLGLLGCMATHHRESLLERAPYLDVIVGPDGYRDLPRLLEESGDPRIEVRLDRGETYADLQPEHGPGPRGWITVMRGCDKFCTFCVVPFTRGRERSLPVEAVLAQVEMAVAAGKREIVFLGQTVNAYRSGTVGFGELLRRAARIDGVKRLRFMSPHPSNFDHDLIAAIAEEPCVMPHVHLPLQSASDPVLAAMQRDYTIDQYRAILARLRDAVPNLAVSTDLIAGFPGESEDDFKRTLDFLDEACFDFAYLFKYSSREGTRAARLEETLDEAGKGRRLSALIERQQTISLRHHRARIGQEVEVLVDGPARRLEGYAVGKSQDFKTTVLPVGNFGVGDLVRVRIADASPHTLIAEGVGLSVEAGTAG